MMTALMLVFAQILWPLVTLGIAALGCYAFVRWLQRDHVTVRGLRAELSETQSDWSQRFERSEHQSDMRLGAMEKRVNALSPAMNPLGSHYSTRSGS